ncbi:rod shape-determining protein RodA [endosymbiont of Euscepes postfasciatus]|uniref:rod shape-determining protein RodA n=1 Tax=endosymbiont of Euscepes postfasciatus TaxID=650377 RepID=UPI000DC72E8F|nr:rod shape-determining protein RodA [endosymbiont of Euscepes postfasciatus]BBA84595.1 rod shape-determining protein RodA [endosymbiont of Euscepes postfasciatus]
MNKKITIDYILILLIYFILMFSMIILFSSSNKDINILKKLIFNIIISNLVMILISKIDKRKLENYSILIYLISILFLVIVHIYGKNIKGAKRWIKIGYFIFQPSEFIKISNNLICSYFIKKFGCPNSNISLFYYLFILLLPVFFIFIQPDLGTSIILLISGLFILFISGINFEFIKKILLFFTILSILSWKLFMKNYQKNRIISLFKNIDNYSTGYHIMQSKIAIGSGGFFGKGLFKGTQNKFKFVPENNTDFIFSVIGEEFGLLGIMLLITLYLIIIYRMICISYKTNDIFSKILISSFIFTFFLNIIINISMTIGILPVVGIPLPLISYGGSSLLSNFIKIGIILSINSSIEDFEINF